jgi:hypothetical protein
MARSYDREELIYEMVIGNKDVNTEAEKSTALGAITKQRLVKTQQNENT